MKRPRGMQLVITIADTGEIWSKLSVPLGLWRIIKLAMQRKGWTLDEFLDHSFREHLAKLSRRGLALAVAG